MAGPANFKTKKSKSEDRGELKKLLKKALVFETTVLSSGKESNYYLDGRVVTLSAEGSLMIARVLLDFLEEYKVDAIGGMTMGADPIVSATSVLSIIENMPLDAFIVRKKPKGYGRTKQIEGPDIKSKKVVLVDDVVTSGASLLKSAQAAQDAGANVIITTAIVDRAEGAKELIEENGFKFRPIFNVKELL